MESDSDTIWAFETRYIFKWYSNGIAVWNTRIGSDTVRCQSKTCHILVAMEFGIHELWPTTTLDDNLRAAIFHRVTTSLTMYCLSAFLPTIHDTPTPPPFDRLLRSLAMCLADGASANSVMLTDEKFVSISVWENLVWHSLVTATPQASVVPVWLLFLLHGANIDFTLNLTQSCNFSTRDKSAKLILMKGHWGSDKRQVHSPILIDEDEDSGGIVELARSQDWSVSLKELTYFWFAPYADKFRRIYELLENTSDISVEGLQDLRRELGLDPQCWQSRMWGDPQSLLKNQWEGYSEILLSSDCDGMRLIDS